MDEAVAVDRQQGVGAVGRADITVESDRDRAVGPRGWPLGGQFIGEPSEGSGDRLAVAVDGEQISGGGVVDDARSERIEQGGAVADGLTGGGSN